MRVRRVGVNTDHNRPSRRDEVMARGLGGARLAARRGHAPRRDRLRAGRLCGSCGYGCPIGAKQSTLRTFLEDATAAGARIVVGAGTPCLRRGRRRSGRRCRPVQVRASGRRGGRRGRDAALLLLVWLDEPDVGRGPGQPATAVFGIFEEEIRPWEGSLQALYSDQLRFLDGGYGVKYETVPLHSALLTAALPWEDAAQHARLMADLPRLSLIAVIPRDSGAGRVLIAWLRCGADRSRASAATRRAPARRRDRRRRTRAGRRRSRGDLHRARAQTALGGELPGRGLPLRRRPGLSLYSFHLMGSARMGASPETSAADPAGQTWDVRNLVVADVATSRPRPASTR